MSLWLRFAAALLMSVCVAESAWAPWAAYAACSRSCGGGLESRIRVCPTADCLGSTRETRVCNVHLCPTGSWSRWTPWTPCLPFSTVAVRQQTRLRFCIGVKCPGVSTERRACSASGGWNAWSAWTACSRSCGIGERRRQRTCAVGGRCVGLDSQRLPCNVPPCIGQWAAWTGWTACSRTCLGGVQTRNRACPSTSPCVGLGRQQQPCNVRACPTTWLSWQAWAPCSVSCGLGTRSRSRACTGSCIGLTKQTLPCNPRTCPSLVIGDWTVWAAWSACTLTCGIGSQTRKRLCNPSTSNCIGLATQRQLCNVKLCPIPSASFLSIANRFIEQNLLG